MALGRMWQVVRAGREGFGLAGIDLDGFVRDFITELVKSGADPVVGDRAAQSGWSLFLRYGGDPVHVADALVNDWHGANVDPDVDGVWFAFPSVWK